MDSGADGRHAAVRCKPNLCSHIPVCNNFHDLLVVRAYGADLQSPDSRQRIFARRTTHAASSTSSGRSWQGLTLESTTFLHKLHESAKSFALLKHASLSVLKNLPMALLLHSLKLQKPAPN